MSQLDETLAGLHAHEGVEHLILLGTDGLLIRHLGDPSALDADTVAAMVPGIVGACGALARASQRGDTATAVIEFSAGVAIVTPAPPDLLVAVLVRRDVGFAPLLRDLRRQRDVLSSLL